MDYSGSMTSIDRMVTSTGDFVTNVESLGINNGWDGLAANSYDEQLNNNITRINKLIKSIKTFNKALENVEKIKEIDIKIKINKNFLSTLDAETDFDKINAVNSAIRLYTEEREKLKASTISLLAMITSGVDVSGGELLYNNTANFDYICDIRELESIVWNSARYGVSKGSMNDGNIADFYADVQANGLSGMDYINSQLDSVLRSYKGREAAVNSTLMLMKLAADKGKKIRYMNAGANGANGVKYNTNEQMIDGMDCCAYVSWAINKGTPQPFHWEGVGGLKLMGDTIDISHALPGDILAKSNSDGSGAHVMMVIANDPETGKITIAESGGDSSDFHLATRDYNYYTNRGYQTQNLEDYYNGIKNNVNGSGSVNFPTWAEKVEYL